MTRYWPASGPAMPRGRESQPPGGRRGEDDLATERALVASLHRQLDDQQRGPDPQEQQPG